MANKFFDLFPRVPYKVDGGRYSSYESITNITFRVAFIQETMANLASYYEYVIKDGDTPETLADRFYDSPYLHWVILYANNIYNPFQDWPMDQRSFRAYINKKYGSMEAAQLSYHHYEMVIKRENDGKVSETRFEIDRTMESFDPNGVAPYDRWDALEYSYLPVNFAETSRVTTDTKVAGRTIIQTVERDRVSNYDWELQQNEARRNIKVIKRQYISNIQSQFDDFTNNARNPFLRKLF
jgi:hypothetical protein